MGKATDNELVFKITGKIKAAAIVVLLTFLLSVGATTANYVNMSNRVSNLEVRDTKTCQTINELLIVNARISENLIYIKENLNDHIRNKK